MRKKYLSALLFGALLLASAGTFTSCKDYDDDIKNLQEQINTVKTSLDELTTKVNNLGAGIKDFKYENGQLVIVTDKDTNFTVDLPACEGIVKLEIKDGVLYADGVAVGNVTGDGGSVVEVKDGVIYIDGKASGELGNKVAVVDNGNGTYTLTVDGKEYVLPKASASVIVNLNVDNTYFTNYTYTGLYGKMDSKGGIVWGKASNYDGKWAGLKPVTKDGLLVGPISTVSVDVLPATFDLSTAKLTLVNSLNEVAPVKVTPVANSSEDLATVPGRAASTDGKWNLQLVMDETVTLDNISTAFAANDNANIGYALAVDGKVVTPYNIVIDTQTSALTTSLVNFDNIDIKLGDKVVTDNTELPLGEATLSLASKCEAGTVEDLDKVYDAYIELTNKDYAESHEISASGMTISSTDKAAAADKVTFKVHVLDVTGEEIATKEYTVKMASSTVEGEAIADQTLTIIPNQDYVLVDLGNTFTGLTADQAEAISNYVDNSDAQTWYFAKDGKTFAEGGVDVEYYASKEDAAKGEHEINVVDGTTSTIRTIKYAKVATSQFKTGAEAGANKLTITLKDAKGNEVKKVSATVTIALPKFDDVVAANTEYTLWDGNTFTTRMKYTDADANGVLPIYNAFISKKDAAGANYVNVNNMVYAVSYKDANGNDVKVNIENLADLKNGKGGLKANEFTAKASICVVKEAQAKLVVSKEFTVKLQTLFEGGKIVYYVNNAAVDVASLPSDRILKAGSVDDKGVKNGLFVTIDKYEVAFKAISTEIGGYTVVSATGTPSATTTINYVIGKKEGSAGTPAVATGGENIVVSGISAGESGEMIFTYTDKGGIKTSSSLKYKM